VVDAVVARGRASRPGRDARIERFARATNDDELAAVSDRTMARSAENPLFCREGDLVLRYHPPEPGETGHDAWGHPIEPPEPKDATVQVKDNVRQEGHDFFAELSGIVLFVQGHVEVRRTMVINKDITGQTEAVDFDGEVYCKSRVRSGGQVQAAGNIIVEGTVEAATLTSTEGDIVLRSGVAGRHRAMIRAENDIIARFAEYANLLAGNEIRLHVGALHSRLIAGHAVEADQGKGQVAGGSVMAGQLIRVKQLGGRGGVQTDATVGVSKKTMDMLGRIDNLIARVQERKDNAVDLADHMQRAVADPHKLQGQERKTYAKLRELQMVCDLHMRQLRERREKLLAQGVESAAGEIKVLTSIMPRVRLTLGSVGLEPESKRGPWTFRYDETDERIISERRS